MKYRVPLARRQLLHEPLKLGLALLGVAVCVALVGLLFGLREGISRQVTTYEDNAGADLYVAAGGTRNFLNAGSSLPASLARELRGVEGVKDAQPLTAWFEVLPLHGKKVVVEHIGFRPARLGGPWELSEGRAPAGPGEIALDGVLASDHGLGVGHPVQMGGRSFSVVGLTANTASWMAPLVFTTRRAAAELRERPGAATFFLVRAVDGTPPEALRARLARTFPDLSVLTAGQIVANDRKLMAGSFDSTLLVMVLTALGVGAIVIGITIYGFVSERRREFGTLKAIGERNTRLYWLVSRQALAIALAGLLAGVLLQRGAGSFVEALWPKFLFVYLPSHLTLMVVAALGMALAGALVPVRVLARLDPVEVFRR